MYMPQKSHTPLPLYTHTPALPLYLGFVLITQRRDPFCAALNLALLFWILQVPITAAICCHGLGTTARLPPLCLHRLAMPIYAWIFMLYATTTATTFIPMPLLQHMSLT